MEADSDEALAKAAGNGDRAAFATLLDRHYDLIFRISFQLLKNRQDAEDLAQDVCISLAKKIASFRGEAAFTTWLYRLTLNAARDRLRKTKRQRQQARALMASAVDDLSAAMDNREQTRLLVDAFDELKDDLRMTALLVVIEGLTHGEAADILGVKEATISWRLAEIRKALTQTFVKDSRGMTALVIPAERHGASDA